MRPVRAGIVAAMAAGALLGMATPAGGQPQPPTGWDGSNPFACELQQAGFGPTGPHPEADPYCIEFDKRHQNVTELGVVDFLSKEPARVAAASDKCFYFQSDHWRGSVVQDDGSTKTYEWDGHYFFDKARSEGGVWVTNFNVNGHTGDPRQLPGIPPDYARYFGPGTGGIITHDDIPGDPSCAGKAGGAGSPVYAQAAPRHGCFAPSGSVDGGHLGPVALGDGESHVRDLLGEPVRVHRGFLRYCQAGGGKFLVGLAQDRTGEGPGGADRVVLVLVTNPSYQVSGIARGSRRSEVLRTFKRARRLFVQGRTRVYATRRGSGVLVGVRLGRVRFLAVYDRAALPTRAALRDALRRSQ
jgi:hypothetical protein